MAVITHACMALLLVATCRGQERTILQVPDVNDTAVFVNNALPNSLGGAGFSIGDPDVLAYGLAVGTYSGPSDGGIATGVSTGQTINRNGASMVGDAANVELSTNPTNHLPVVTSEGAGVLGGKPYGMSANTSSIVPTQIPSTDKLNQPVVKYNTRRSLK